MTAAKPTPLPPPLPLHKPHPARRTPPYTLLPTLASLLLIALLRPPLPTIPLSTWWHAHPATTTPSGLFHARDTPSYYSRRRSYAPYAYGRVCSGAARVHFRSRFDRPFRGIGAGRRTRSVVESRNRVLLSSIPEEVGDGLGHRTCILNFELQMALWLGLTYAHRESGYGSLTRGDAGAVERLFGWGVGEVKRADVLREGCEEVGYVKDGCEIAGWRVECRRVRGRRKGGQFDQLVVIPAEVSECFSSAGGGGVDACFGLVQGFLAAYSEPNTLFQMGVEGCYHHFLYTNFSETGEWFKDKYWGAGFGGVVEGVEGVRERELGWEAGRVQVALHVRRGDFFNYTNRVLIPDETFVDMVGRVKVGLDEVMGRNVPVTVHVYSEGVVGGGGRVKDNHDVGTMEAVYVNEVGERMGPGHWGRLIRGGARLSAMYGVGRGWERADVEVRVHVASDTIQALHEMIAADVFVGSLSGLSMQVVRNIGRGLILLPVHESEVAEHEFVVPFDYARNHVASFVNETLLYERIGELARKNRLACAVW